MIQLIILLILLVFVSTLAFVVFSAFLGFVLTRIPFVPSRPRDIEYVISKLGLSPSDYVYELGSGDGTVVFLVERLTGARVKGFELTWWTHLLARLKKKIKKSHAEFLNQNFMKASWSEATVIYGYLYPFVMGSIEEKFLAEMRPGSLAVIRDFPFPNLKPEAVYFMPKEHEIYIYRK